MGNLSKLSAIPPDVKLTWECGIYARGDELRNRAMLLMKFC